MDIYGVNVVDLAALVVLGAFVVKGVLRGLLKELCGLLGLTLGAFVAFHFQAPLAANLVESLHLPSRFAVVAAFALLFLSVVAAFAVLGYLLSRFVNLLFLGGFNRVAGGVFGLIQGGVLLALVAYAFSLATLPDLLARAMAGSQLVAPLAGLGEAMFQSATALFSRSA